MSNRNNKIKIEKYKYKQHIQNKNDLWDDLKHIFSNKVIIRKDKNNRLKIIDTHKIQQAKNIDRYDRLYRSNTLGGSSLSTMPYGYEIIKTQLYRDYEEMDRDPIISSALDLYSQESVTKNEFGDILTIKSSNEKIQAVLDNLFYEVLNIQFNLSSWIRNMCKYGDCFLYLDIKPKYGIVNVIPLSVYEVTRQQNFDHDSDTTKFVVHTNIQQYFEQFQIAHFRLVTDSNYLPYGRSAIQGARKTWKQLMLLEDAMLIHKIMRAPEKRIFKVNVGNLSPEQIEPYMNKLINKMKKVPFIDKKTGDYNLRFNMMNMTEDYFIPDRNGEAGHIIDTLNGMDIDFNNQLTYLRNKMMASLRIPFAHLGYEQATGSKATLANEDVRSAKNIQKLQKIVVSELESIAQIHLISQGFKGFDLSDYELQLTNSSIIYEQQKLNLWDQKVNLISSMQNTRLFSIDFMYSEIFNLSQDKIKNMKTKLQQDTKFMWILSQIEQNGKLEEQKEELTDDDLHTPPNNPSPKRDKGDNDFDYDQEDNETPLPQFKGGDEQADKKVQLVTNIDQDKVIKGKQTINIDGKQEKQKNTKQKQIKKTKPKKKVSKLTGQKGLSGIGLGLGPDPLGSQQLKKLIKKESIEILKPQQNRKRKRSYSLSEQNLNNLNKFLKQQNNKQVMSD